jgi:hypothetical protein
MAFSSFYERVFRADLLLRGPFAGPVPADPSSSLFFWPSFFSSPPESAAASTAAGPPSSEPRRTPKDDAGGSGQIVPEYHIAPTGTEPPFCSCRVSPSLKAAAVFQQGDNVPSFASLPSLSVAYFVLCVCVIWNSNFFLTILFVNPTPVSLELRFNSIPFVSRSHRSLYKYRRRLAGISLLVQIYFVRYRSGPFIEFFCLFVAIIFGFGHIEQ